MSPTNVIYCRSGKEDGIPFSIVKFDLADSIRNPYANGAACSAALDGRNAMSDMFIKTLHLLERYGLRAYVPNRIRKGKQFGVGTPELPEEELRRLGWRIRRYPRKYSCALNRADALDRARRYGLHIDASNLIFNRNNIHGALALKAIIDWCNANGVNWHVYFDNKTWGALWKGDRVGYQYFQERYNLVVDGCKRFCTPPKAGAKTADDFMFDYADRDGGSIVSRDSFDEWDYLGWTLNGAEFGKQRLHKFWTTDTTVSIPDIGLYATVPTSY